MDKDYLTLKRAAASRPSGEWSDDDYDVLAEGKAVGRIFKVHAAPEGTPWMWTLLFGYHEDRTPTHGYEPTRGTAMADSPRAGDGNSPAPPLVWPLAPSASAMGIEIAGGLLHLPAVFPIAV